MAILRMETFWNPSATNSSRAAFTSRARVAAETLVTTGLVVLAGEITTHAVIDYPAVAREAIKRIGYDNTDFGIDYKGCAVLVCYDRQSPDIAAVRVIFSRTRFVLCQSKPLNL